MSNKHKNFDMLVAKAANMNLILFVKYGGSDDWKESESIFELPDSQVAAVKYYLCLPEHKEACLHWLNGGEIEARSHIGQWHLADSYSDSLLKKWSPTDGFMCELMNLRIKPKKSKRWIAYRNGNVYGPYETESCAISSIGSNCQLIKIEVEL